MPFPIFRTWRVHSHFSRAISHPRFWLRSSKDRSIARENLIKRIWTKFGAKKINKQNWLKILPGCSSALPSAIAASEALKVHKIKMKIIFVRSSEVDCQVSQRNTRNLWEVSASVQWRGCRRRHEQATQKWNWLLADWIWIVMALSSMPWTRQIFAQFLFQEPYRQRRVTSHLAFQRTKLWLGICGIWGIASFLAPPILQSVAAIEIPTFHELRTSPKSLFRFIWAHLSCPCQHPLRHGEKRRDDVIKPKMSSSHKNKQWISHVFPDFLMKHIFRFAHLWFGSGFPRNFCRRCIGKHRFHRNFHWRDPLQCKKYDKQFHHRDCTLIRFILKLFAWNNFGFSPYAAFLWRTFAIVSVILPRTKPLGPTFGFASKVATFIARNATGQVSFESLRGFD